MSDIMIHHYDGAEKPHKYDPPPEIKILVGKGIRAEIYKHLGPLELTQKIIGYMANNTHLMTPNLMKKLTQDMREEVAQFDFDSTNDVFNFNYKRKQFGDESCVLAPCDGFLSHQEISYGQYEGYVSKFLSKIDIDINKMIGVDTTKIVITDDSYNRDESLAVIEEIKPIFTSLGGGIHDTSILKPEDKHAISVPMESTVKMIYRIDRDGSLHPAETNKISIGKGFTYSTDPEPANQNEDNENTKDKDILDGNPRMVFVLTTNIEGEELDYIMVAHSASFVRGIEPLKKVGDNLNPGEILLKFHFGSSVSTLYPARFTELREIAPDIEENSKGQNLLKVQEGEVLYLPKKLPRGTISINKNSEIISE